MTPLRVLRPQPYIERRHNASPLQAGPLAVCAALLLALMLASGAIGLYRMGRDAGNADVVYRVVDEKLDELLRLAVLGDSIRASLTKRDTT